MIKQTSHNATYELTDAQAKTSCNRGTAVERLVEKILEGWGSGPKQVLLAGKLTLNGFYAAHGFYAAPY